MLFNITQPKSLPFYLEKRCFCSVPDNLPRVLKQTRGKQQVQIMLYPTLEGSRAKDKGASPFAFGVKPQVVILNLGSIITEARKQQYDTDQ